MSTDNSNTPPETLDAFVARMRRWAKEGLAVAAGYVADCVEAAAEREKNRANTAAMRDALERIRRVCANQDNADSQVREWAEDFADAALSEPARNCDVGTAEAQAERFEAECKRHDHCTPCPVHAAWGEFRKGKPKSCQLIWSQMPFEAKGGAK